jgi:hypothetical protein
MPILDSSVILAAGYQAETRMLRVTFRGTGKTYDYLDVPPETYAAFMASESYGTWFNEHIRDHFRFQRVRGPVRVL